MSQKCNFFYAFFISFKSKTHDSVLCQFTNDPIHAAPLLSQPVASVMCLPINSELPINVSWTVEPGVSFCKIICYPRVVFRELTTVQCIIQKMSENTKSVPLIVQVCYMELKINALKLVCS